MNIRRMGMTSSIQWTVSGVCDAFWSIEQLEASGVVLRDAQLYWTAAPVRRDSSPNAAEHRRSQSKTHALAFWKTVNKRPGTF